MRYLLYSTNVFLKLVIQERYFHDIHFVWCSEYFDNEAAPKYSSGTLVPPSSNPASIYRALLQDVKGQDKHSAKITAQKASFTARAIENFNEGTISEEAKDEIIYIVDNTPFEYWRPLLYIIPSEFVKDRVDLVPIEKRAGLGNEYIIKDLKRNEFDIVEF